LELLSLNDATQVSDISLADNTQVNVVVGLATLGQIQDKVRVHVPNNDLALVDIRDDRVVVRVSNHLDSMALCHSQNDLSVQVCFCVVFAVLSYLHQLRRA